MRVVFHSTQLLRLLLSYAIFVFTFQHSLFLLTAHTKLVVQLHLWIVVDVNVTSNSISFRALAMDAFNGSLLKKLYIIIRPSNRNATNEKCVSNTRCCSMYLEFLFLFVMRF